MDEYEIERRIEEAVRAAERRLNEKIERLQRIVSNLEDEIENLRRRF